MSLLSPLPLTCLIGILELQPLSQDHPLFHHRLDRQASILALDLWADNRHHARNRHQLQPYLQGRAPQQAEMLSIRHACSHNE